MGANLRQMRFCKATRELMTEEDLIVCVKEFHIER